MRLKDEITNYFRTSLARGSMYMLISRFVVMGVGVATHIINTRVLGPEMYGVFALCISALMLFSGLETGLSSSITKYISEYSAQSSPSKIYAIYRDGMKCEFVLFLTFTVSFVVIAKYSRMFTNIRHTFFLLIPILLLNACLSFLGSTIIGLKKLKEFSYVQSIQSIFYLFFLCFLLFILNLRVYGSLLAFLLGILSAVVFSCHIVYHQSKQYFKNQTDISMVHKILLFAAPVTIAAFFSNLIISGGPLIYKLISNDAVSLGYLSLLITLGNRIRQVFLVLSKSTFPYISSWEAGEYSDKIKKVIYIFTLSMIVVATILVVLLKAYGKIIVFAVYGHKYKPVYTYLVLTCVVYIIAAYKDFLAIVLNAIGEPSYNMVNMVITTTIFMITIWIGSIYVPLIKAILYGIGCSYGYYIFITIYFLYSKQIL